MQRKFIVKESNLTEKLKKVMFSQFWSYGRTFLILIFVQSFNVSKGSA